MKMARMGGVARVTHTIAIWAPVAWLSDSVSDVESLPLSPSPRTRPAASPPASPISSLLFAFHAHSAVALVASIAHRTFKRWQYPPRCPPSSLIVGTSIQPRATMPQLLPPRSSTSFLSKSAASLSRSPSVTQRHPTLLHTLHQEHSSVLSLAADNRYIYTGSQDGQICVCIQALQVSSLFAAQPRR